MFNPIHSGLQPEPMAVGALFSLRDGRTIESLPWKADLTRGRNKRNEVLRGVKNKLIKKSKNGIYGCKEGKRCINFGGQGKPSPIRTINKVPTRRTRRKRRMNLGQKNRIMINSTERGKTRPGEIKDNRRAKRQVNTQKRISSVMIARREARQQREKSEVTENSTTTFGEATVSSQEG